MIKEVKRTFELLMTVNIRKQENDNKKFYEIIVNVDAEDGHDKRDFMSSHTRADLVHLKKRIMKDFPKFNYTTSWIQLPWSNFERSVEKFILALMNDEQIRQTNYVREFFQIPLMTENKAPKQDSFGEQRFDLGNTERKDVVQSDYEFLSPIGHGACGQLFLVKDKIKNQFYAVKVVEKKQINISQDSKRIMTERNLLVKTRENPFFCKIFFSFQSENKLFFLLEYLNGGDLYTHIQSHSYIPEKRIIFYSAEIACALGYLHENFIIYRDLKPENIMINSEGHIVLTDFGLCKEIIKRKTANSFCGTPEYIAPEILCQKPYMHAVDWWALGCVIFEMYHRVPPFYSQEPSKIVKLILEHRIVFKADVPEPARNIITAFLEINPDRRLGSNGDLEQIKKDEFYASINWAMLMKRKIKPDYKPKVKSREDTSLVPDEFKNGQISESIVSSYKRGLFVQEEQKKQSKNFVEGFSYCPKPEDLKL